jgi:hypothetical protein
MGVFCANDRSDKSQHAHPSLAPYLLPPTTRHLRLVCLQWHAAVARSLDALCPAQPQLALLPAAFPGLASLDLTRCRRAPQPAPLTAGLHRLRLASIAADTTSSASTGGEAPPLLEPSQLAALTQLHRLRDLRLGDANAIAADAVIGAAAGTAATAAAAEPAACGVVDQPIGFTLATDAHLLALQPLAPQLQRLDLSGCVHVSDAGLLGMSRLTGLRELKLRRCVGVSDAGLIGVAQLDNLTSLDVSGCPRVRKRHEGGAVLFGARRLAGGVQSLVPCAPVLRSSHHTAPYM